ncbi:MAG: dTDP-4-dehydrorhamnose reductase [Xanthomonadales bacterium]|nr:dTDP-4-dehydrorhamnose reductase [Xanthomonadales bacterium]
MAGILLLGGNGQVGFELLRHLAPLAPVHAATRSGRLPAGAPCLSVDLAQPGSAADAIAQVQPSVIVNAAAYTAVDRAEDEIELAQRINGQALAEIGAGAREHSALVVHYSTDYVFPGDADTPYGEHDATGPVSSYGASKLAGEQALAASGAEHMIFRTAWVYAARGHNFLRTMLRLAAEREQLSVVDDQLGSPTPAWLIAAASAQAIARWRHAEPGARAGLQGIWHLTSSGHTSWHGFARAIFERAADTGLLARIPQLAAIGSDQFPTRAKRPAWSVLDNQRFCRHFGLHLPPWQEGLDQVLMELAEC